MSRGVHTAMALGGAGLLGLSMVSLVPMLVEDAAARRLHDRYDIERLAPRGTDSAQVTFRCGTSWIGLGLDSGDAEALPRERARIRIGEEMYTTEHPLPVRTDGDGVPHFGGAVVPFRIAADDTESWECGVVYRLPPDTLAVRRAWEGRSRTIPGAFLEGVRGVRPAYLHGLRFRVLRWEEGGAVRSRTFEFADWDGDPYGTLVVNLLAGPVGVKNQTHSTWPSLLVPIIYPLGTALLGVGLLGFGVVGLLRGRHAGNPDEPG